MLNGTSLDSRLPITPNILCSFAKHLHTGYLDQCTLWAALLTAFFGFLRSSELLGLQHSDITRSPSQYRISVRQSKTDPFRRVTMVTIMASGDSSLCAVSVLDHLLASTPNGQGPLFRFQTGAPLTKERLNRLIRLLASQCSIPAKRYSSHSFRIGAASAAAAAGIPDWKIQALGRWSSDCYHQYIRLPQTETNRVATAMTRVYL